MISQRSEIPLGSPYGGGQREYYETHGLNNAARAQAALSGFATSAAIYAEDGDDFSLLRNAARLITEKQRQDAQSMPDPWELFEHSSYSRDYTGGTLCSEGLLRIKQHWVLPDILLAQFHSEGENLLRTHSFMGLLSRIERAWLSVEGRLFVWAWGAGGGRDFVRFDELPEGAVIVDVALARPRSGVFVEEIEEVLLVATANEIVLLGVRFGESGGEKKMELVSTGLVFPTDGVKVLAVAGTLQGRIFVGAQDGNVYELEYEAEEGWFTRRCRKVNRTSGLLRRLLVPTFLQRLSQGSGPISQLLVDDSRQLLWTLQDSSVHVFSLANGSFNKIALLDDLIEQAVRLCPAGLVGEQMRVASLAIVPVEDSTHIHAIALCSNGVRLFLTTLSREQRQKSRTQLLSLPVTEGPSGAELIHVRLAPPVSDGGNVLSEWGKVTPKAEQLFCSHGCTISVSTCDGEDQLMITSINQALALNRTASLHGGRGSHQLLASEQNVSEPLQFVHGKVWSISAVSAINSVVAPFQSMCFEAAWSTKRTSQSIVLLANTGIFLLERMGPLEELQRLLLHENGSNSEGLKAFCFAYGSAQACFFALSLAISSARAESSLEQLAISALLRWASFPIAVSPSELSPLLHGFFAYAARLLHGIWHLSLTDLLNKGKIFDDPSLELHGLRELMRRHPLLSALRETLEALSNLLALSSELLALLAICRDYGISEDSHLTFEDLLASSVGRQAVAELGTKLVQRQLKLCSSVDSLCQVLQQRAPSFFGAQQAILFQGTESLDRALHARDPVERTALLDESLALFLQTHSIPSLPMLQEIANKYQRLAFFPGTVRLALATELGEDLVFDALRVVHGLVPAQLDPSVASSMSGDHAIDRLQRATMTVALTCQKEDFHERLYQWLVQEGFVSVLLDIKSSFVLPFLKKRFAERDPLFLDLLWKYQARNGLALDAARTLYELALSSYSFSLPERIERLSLALGQLRCASSSLDAMTFVQEVEERLDVAHLQLQLLDQLTARYGHVAEEAALHDSLFSLSDLFNRFAKPLRLTTVALAILHASNHHDTLLVHELWNELARQEERSAVNAPHLPFLAQRIAELARRFYPAPSVFPLTFVLDLLLQKTGSAKEASAWDLVQCAFLFEGSPIDKRALLASVNELLSLTATFWQQIEHRRILVDLKEHLERC